MSVNSHHIYGSTNDCRPCTVRQAALLSAGFLLLFLILIVAIVVFIPVPALLQYLGFDELLVLADVGRIKDSHTEYHIGELIKNGTLISVKDFWEFQSFFYTTVITLLIFINTILAGLAFFYIRGNSADEARSYAQKFLHGNEFKSDIEMLATQKANDVMCGTREDYNDLVETIKFDLVGRIETMEAKNKVFEEDRIEVMQKFKVISARLAFMDKDDNEGSALYLSDEG